MECFEHIAFLLYIAVLLNRVFGEQEDHHLVVADNESHFLEVKIEGSKSSLLGDLDAVDPTRGQDESGLIAHKEIFVAKARDANDFFP